MRPIHGCRRLNHTGDAHEAKKPSVGGHTESGSVATKYHKLMHCRCTSLDLETAFVRIQISQEVIPDTCQDYKTEKCRCPAFMPETPCSSVLSMPTNTNIDEQEIPDLVENTTLRMLYPPVLSSSDEEADWEVAAICSAPVYYQVRSRNTDICFALDLNSLVSLPLSICHLVVIFSTGM